MDAEFMVCKKCGVYVAAVMTDANPSFATLNVNVLENMPVLEQLPQSVSYEGETKDEKVARRKTGWTPAKVRLT